MFKKKSYSDLEVQEIMEALFLEKKKVKDLQLKLNNCSLSPSIVPSEDLGKLNAEISILHTRLEETKQTSEQNLLTLQAELKKAKDYKTQKEINLEAEIKNLLIKKDEWSLREQLLEREFNTLKKSIESGGKSPKELQLEEEIRTLLIKQEEGSLREHAAEQKHQALATELKNLKEHNLQKELNLEAEVRSLLIKKDELSLREQQAEQRLEPLKAQILQLHFQIEQKTEKELNLEAEVHRLSVKKHEWEQKELDLEAEVQRLLIKKNELEQKHISIEPELLSLKANLEEKTQKEQALKAEMQSLLVKKEEGLLREKMAEQKRFSLEAELNALRDLEPLKPQIKQLLAQIEEKNQKELQLEAEIRNLQLAAHLFESSANELELVNAQVKKLTEKERQLEAEIQKLQVQLEAKPAQDKQKEAQLERVVQFMRARLEEAQSENQQMVLKFKEVEEASNKLKEEILEIQAGNRKIAETLQLEKQEKQAIQEEEQALRMQMLQLQEEILRTKSCVDQASAETTSHQEALSNSAREIELLKQMMMKALQESKEERLNEEQAYQAQITTLNELYEKEKENGEILNRLLKEQTKSLEENQEQLNQLEASVKELSENSVAKERAYLELAQFSEEMKLKLAVSSDEKSHYHESLEKKEELINNLSSQVAALSKAQEKTTEILKEKELEEQEHEAHLRAAQQHLAKKMREAALLAEQNQDLTEAIATHEKALESAKSKLAEAKATLENEANQKLNLQKQYQEGIKVIESQCAKWEEKYFQLQEKWQATETQNRELKRLEERFGKLQSMFSHMGSIMSPQEENIPVPVKKFSEIETLSSETSLQPVLFDPAPKSQRYKESFFV